MIYLDTETFSEVPIKDGTYVYTASCEVMLVTWAVDDGPVQCWDRTADPEIPFDLLFELEGDDPITAHNAMFDRQVLKESLGLDIPIERWRDTMVKAYLHGLPGGLERIGEALNIHSDKQKLKDGKKLIHLFCKPRPLSSGIPRATRLTHPEEWARFIDYAKADIEAMREADRIMPSWNYREGSPELALWHLDQKINDRGFQVDVALAAAAIKAVKDRKDELKIEASEATGGVITSTGKRDELLAYLLEAYGVGLPDLQKNTLQRRIDDPDMPEELKDLLRMRMQSSTTAASKYNALVKAVSTDGRLRGTKQFAGAMRTARWAGRTFQPDNLPRPTLPDDQINAGIDALLADCADLFTSNVIALASSAVRKCIVPTPGNKLVIADLANIEGRVAAWLAGEGWKIHAFQQYDSGTGPDMYNLSYARSFGIHHKDVKKPQRQIGKVQELMLQYESGVGGFLTGAAAYNIDLDDMTIKARPSIPDEVWDEATNFYDWLTDKKAPTFGLRKEVFCVCDSLKRMWRRQHSAIASIWPELKALTTEAIENPGVTFTCRRLKIRRDGAWLRIVLPSGRALCYPSPRVDDGQISYMGVSQYTRKWERIKTYGGKLFENCLAENTRVITLRGVINIQDLQLEDRVWDGVDWVTHSGCIYQGKQLVYPIFGVSMTSEHKVLTTKGWKNASSCEGYYRAACRLPDSYPLCRERREKVNMGGALRLRTNDNAGRVGAKKTGREGDSFLMRLLSPSNNWRAECQTRHVSAPGVCGVARDARPMPLRHSPRLEELWRSRHNSLQALAKKLRSLLARYGSRIPTWANAGTNRQYAGVLENQLPLADSKTPSEQYPEKFNSRHPTGADDSYASGGVLPPTVHNTALPASAWLAEEAVIRAVYDILNCGPRKRFVAIGDSGPLIVHNCVQAIARDVLAYNMPTVEDAGYEIALHVHDEIVADVPNDERFSAEGLASLMCAELSWAKGLPLAAAGFETMRYRKD